MTSPDGINWTTRTAAGDNDSWTDVTYGNGRFIAVADSGDRVMYSGKPEARAFAANNIFQGDHAFMAKVGIGTNSPTDALEVVGEITSKGTSWATTTAAGDNDSWQSVAYGNGTFVAVGSSGDLIMTSSDGVTWSTTTAAGDNDNWYDVTYGNGLFVAVGDEFGDDQIMTSPDGITWTVRSSTGEDNWTSVTYANGLFVVVGECVFGGGCAATSPDGSTWATTTAAGGNERWQSVTHGNGLFVAVGLNVGEDRVMTSSDGITWTARTAAGDDDSWNSVTYANGTFVAVGDGSDRVMTSPDGITWTARTAAGDDDSWNSVTYGNGLFVAVGYCFFDDCVMTSPDGITWTARTAAGDEDLLNSVTYGNGRFVAVSSSDNRVVYSGRPETTSFAHNNILQGGRTIFGGLSLGTTTVDQLLTIDGNAYLTGALFDSTNASGTNGMILQSTAAGTQWAATSSLGLGDGTFLGLADTPSSYTGNRLYFSSSTANTVLESSQIYVNDDGTALGIGVSPLSGFNKLTVGGLSTRALNGNENDSVADIYENNFIAGGVDVSGDTLSISASNGASSGANTWSGNVLSVERNGLNIGGSHNITGAVARITDQCIESGGTCTSSANVLELVQEFEANTGTVLNITSSSTNGGFVFRANDDGTLTDNTPFVIDQDGNVGIGTTTPNAKLSLQNDILSGAGISGLSQYLTTTNSVDAAVQFGNYLELNASNTATTTIVGGIYRIADDTTFGNTVRGLEVQTNRGGNTQGENTALSGFARTFGVRGVTSGDAGGSFEPAGGFFETQGTTQGNAVRGFSDTITTATLLSLFQSSSTFAGTGLEMNFGNAGGDFSSTSSKYLDFQNAGTSVFTVSAFGTTTIGDGTTNNQAGLQIGYGGLCVDNDGTCSASTTGRISSVSSLTGNSDLAEMYFSDQNLEPGEIVVLRDELSVRRATESANTPILGVVSTKPGLTLGFDDTSTRVGETGYPLALTGRVPVKLSTENGPIQAGDALMLSSLPGIAMKSDGTGTTVGIALEGFDEDRMYSDTYINQFGDDIADPVYTPITQNNDPRINDGCYFSGGGEAGDAPCVPLETHTVSDQIAEANELAEAEAIADALKDLQYVPSDTHTLVDGTRVQVGQVVMFVDRAQQLLTSVQLAQINALMSTSSLSEQVDEDESETVLDRLVALADSFVAGVLSVFELRADRVETNELCVDGVCVTADDLQTLLDGAYDTEPSAVQPEDDQESSDNGTSSEEDEVTEESSGSSSTASATSTISSTTADVADAATVVASSTESTVASSTATSTAGTEVVNEAVSEPSVDSEADAEEDVVGVEMQPPEPPTVEPDEPPVEASVEESRSDVIEESVEDVALEETA